MRTARDWLTKAAQQGYVPSMYSLAKMYEHGGAIGRDYDKALYWYRKAAELGHPKAPRDAAELEKFLSR